MTDVLAVVRANKMNRWASERSARLEGEHDLLDFLHPRCSTPARLADALFAWLWADPLPGTPKKSQTHLIGNWAVTLWFGLGAYQPFEDRARLLLELGGETTLRSVERSQRLAIERLAAQLAASMSATDTDRDGSWRADGDSLPPCLRFGVDAGVANLLDTANRSDWMRAAAVAKSALTAHQGELIDAIDNLCARLEAHTDPLDPLDDANDRVDGGKSDRDRRLQRWAASALAACLQREIDEVLDHHRGLHLPAVDVDQLAAPSPSAALAAGNGGLDLADIVAGLGADTDRRRVERLATHALGRLVRLEEAFPGDPEIRRLTIEAGRALLRAQAVVEDTRAYQTARLLAQVGAFDDLFVYADAIADLLYVDTVHGQFVAGHRRIARLSRRLEGAEADQLGVAQLRQQLQLLYAGFVLRQVRDYSDVTQVKTELEWAQGLARTSLHHLPDDAPPAVYEAAVFRRQQELSLEQASWHYHHPHPERRKIAADHAERIGGELADLPGPLVDNLSPAWQCHWHLFATQVSFLSGDLESFERHYNDAALVFADRRALDASMESVPVLERFSYGQAVQRFVLTGLLASHRWGLALDGLALDDNSTGSVVDLALNPPHTAPSKRRRAAAFLRRSFEEGAVDADDESRMMDLFFKLR